MNNLLKLTVEAHGGLRTWNRFSKISVHMLVGGIIWKAKGQDGVINDSHLEIDLRQQKGRFIAFDNNQDLETSYDPNRVAIFKNGKLVEELMNPRSSFNGHIFETPWTKLQLVYFGTYSMWEYLTIPFNFTLPGFEAIEIEPWHEAGEMWRRLQVTFPGHIGYHTKEQIFFFDEHGLLKRIDYELDISQNAAAAHYVFDYKEFQGIKIPTRGLVYARDCDGHYIKQPLVVRNDLLKVKFI